MESKTLQCDDTKNKLHITRSEDGDIWLDIDISKDENYEISKSIRLRMSGSKMHKNYSKVVYHFNQIMELINDEEKEQSKIPNMIGGSYDVRLRRNYESNNNE
jgi:hypothetical protein